MQEKETDMPQPLPPFHQMVWIDHRSATTFEVTRHELTELVTIHAPDQGRGHVHHKAGSVGPGHENVSPVFLQRVAEALAGARRILIVGPADAKFALKHYIALNLPVLDEHVIGVEPMDKCSHGDLQAFATLFFRQADQISSQ